MTASSFAALALAYRLRVVFETHEETSELVPKQVWVPMSEHHNDEEGLDEPVTAKHDPCLVKS